MGIKIPPTTMRESIDSIQLGNFKEVTMNQVWWNLKCGISNVRGCHRIGKMHITFLLIMFCSFLIMATLIMQNSMPRPLASQFNDP
jgi:hypothetical protein